MEAANLLRVGKESLVEYLFGKGNPTPLPKQTLLAYLSVLLDRNRRLRDSPHLPELYLFFSGSVALLELMMDEITTFAPASEIVPNQ